VVHDFYVKILLFVLFITFCNFFFHSLYLHFKVIETLWYYM
jgi:hypothetical protein